MTEFDLIVCAALAGMWLTFGVAGIVILGLSLRRPTDEMDDRLAAVDEELTWAESRRRDRDDFTRGWLS